jgi:hypothetical protein
MVRRFKNYELFGIWKEEVLSHRGTIKAFSWKDWEESRYTSVRTDGVPAEIRTLTIKKRYRYSNPLGHRGINECHKTKCKNSRGTTNWKPELRNMLEHNESPQNVSQFEHFWTTVNKKFCTELIAYFRSIRYGPHIKWRLQQILRCCGNMFTKPLPSNDTGVQERGLWILL